MHQFLSYRKEAEAAYLAMTRKRRLKTATLLIEIRDCQHYRDEEGTPCIIHRKFFDEGWFYFPNGSSATICLKTGNILGYYCPITKSRYSPGWEDSISDEDIVRSVNYGLHGFGLGWSYTKLKQDKYYKEIAKSCLQIN